MLIIKDNKIINNDISSGIDTIIVNDKEFFLVSNMDIEDVKICIYKSIDYNRLTFYAINNRLTFYSSKSIENPKFKKVFKNDNENTVIIIKNNEIGLYNDFLDFANSMFILNQLNN